MPYGTIKVDTITFTSGSSDVSVAISGLVQNPTFSGNVTVTGTVSGTIVRGNTVSGATVTGTTGQFGTLTGTTANFVTVSGNTLSTITGIFASGSAANPSITFSGDLDTGLFTGAANTVSIGANGAAVLTVSGTRVGVGTTNPGGSQSALGTFFTSGACPLLIDATGAGGGYLAIDNNGTIKGFLGIGTNVGATSINDVSLRSQSGDITFQTNGANERMRVDSSGRLLIGNTSARANFFNSTNTAMLQVEGTGSNTSASRASLSIVNNNVVDNDQMAYLILGRSYGTTVGANNLVTVDGQLGKISFQGADGTELVEGASIAAFVDGTSAANDMPTRLVLSTTADGASSSTPRITIKENGNVGIATTNPGYHLELVGSNPTLGIRTSLQSATSQSTLLFRNKDGNGNDYDVCKIVAVSNGNGGYGDLVFHTAFNNNLPENIRITRNGNLLFGGTNSKIDSTTSDEIQFHSYLTLGQFATGSCPGYLGWNISATSTAGTYQARTSGDKASVLTLNSGGDLFYSAATTTQTAGNNLTNFGERVRFLNAGGITFNGDTAAANALDDYEEGTWIPTVTGTDAGTFTLNGSINTFKYTKIGRVVYISGRINITGTSGTSGSVKVGNFPFANGSGTAQSAYAALPVIHHDFDLAADALGECFLEYAPSASDGVIYYLRDALSWESVKVGSITANETYFYITGYYFVD